MFKIMNDITGRNHNIMVSSVAPPCDSLLDRRLQNLSITHILLANGQKMEGFTKAIKVVNDEQIDLARLQFMHAIKEIKEQFADFFWDQPITTEYLDKPESNEWHTLLFCYVSKIQNHVQKLQGYCEEHPKELSVITSLISSMKPLLEGIIVLEKVKDKYAKNKFFQFQLNTILETQNKILKDHEKLESLGNFYDNIKNNIVSIKALNIQAIKNLEKQLSTKIKIDFEKVDISEIFCGHRNQLWDLVQNSEKKQKAIEQKNYIKLSKEDTEYLRSNMIALFEGWDVCNEEGIINLMMMTQNTLIFKGNQKIQNGSSQSEDVYMNKLEQKEKNKKQFPNMKMVNLSKEKELKEIKNKLDFERKYGINLLRVSDVIEDGLNEISNAFNIKNSIKNEKPILLIENTENENILLGKINDNSENYLVIFKDSVNKESAVYAATVPKNKLDKLPSLDELQNSKIHGSNFNNFESFLIEINKDFSQEFFFNKKVQVKNNTKTEKLVSASKAM